MGYSFTFLLAVSLGSSILYFSIRKTIENNIESELKNSTNIILNMVQAATASSIRNNLRAVAEKNREIIRHFYLQYKEKIISEIEAQNLSRSIMLSQSIGRTGYIYCIDSAGVIKIHPKNELIGKDLSEYDFIRQQKERREGYLEYKWANPGENVERPKALYMTYFGPWDWIISVSSYRDEFKNLFSVDDIRDSILSHSFGKTGYSYVIDSKGKLIVHPKLQGHNIYNSEDAGGRMFIKEICERKTGKIIYPWKNPGEEKAREKLVIFNYIPNLDWIVASSSYLEEFYKPLKYISYITMLTVGMMILMSLPLTWWISNSITRPIRRLINDFSTVADKEFSILEGGEIDRLTSYYNQFIEKLHEYSRRLRDSEEKYRSIFENAVEGVFQSNLKGKFLNANPSMARMLGYKSPEELIHSVSDIGNQIYVELAQRDKMIKILEDHDTVSSFETRFYRKDGTIIWVSLNARAVRDDPGKLIFMEGFLTDITSRKTAEAIQEKSREELEERVRGRTAELSKRIKELEQHNLENEFLMEMGEMLQVCLSTQETYPVIQMYVRKLFPEYAGIIYVFNGQRSFLKPIVSWGNPENSTHLFSLNDCWAMRQGKAYFNKKKGDRLFCSHLDGLSVCNSACVPMISQGEIVGLLHLQYNKQYEPNRDSSRRIERTMGLAVIIAEHLALALTNLNLRETLRIQSIQDPLTGLYNRRYMEKTLEREASRIQRDGSSLGIIIFDIDHFKNINDTYGHECGDAVLRELGKYIQKHSREEDVACRYGGEEFALIMINADLKNALAKAENILRGIRENLKVHFDGKVISIKISLGVSVCPDHGLNPKQAIKAADEALYQAKTEGRDRLKLAVFKKPATNIKATE